MAALKVREKEASNLELKYLDPRYKADQKEVAKR